MNLQAITDGANLATNVFGNEKDPIESELPRTAMRAGGFVGGILSNGAATDGLVRAMVSNGAAASVFAGMLLSSGGAAVAFALDAACDTQKLNLLKKKTELLHTFALDLKSDDLEKAKSSIKFQANVYNNIKTYTTNALIIKTIAALSFATSAMGLYTISTSGKIINHVFQAENQERFLRGVHLSSGGAVLGLYASLAALGHQWIAKPALEKKNQELAYQFFEVK